MSTEMISDEDKKANQLRKQEEAKIRHEKLYGKDAYFYHSRVHYDLLNQGRRITICAVIGEDNISFGVSKGHKLDSKKWSKELGRLISVGRARKEPVLVVMRPIDRVKHFAVETMKDICREWMLTGKDGEPISKEQAYKELQKRRKLYERKQAQLDREDVVLVELTQFLAPQELEQA